MFHEFTLIDDGFIVSWTNERVLVEISREFNIHVFCLFASSVLCVWLFLVHIDTFQIYPGMHPVVFPCCLQMK